MWAQNFRDGPDWVPAVVADQVGPLTFLVQLRSGEMWRRHIDSLRAGPDRPLPEETQRVSGQGEDGLSPLVENDSEHGTQNGPDAPLTVTAPPDSAPLQYGRVQRI